MRVHGLTAAMAGVAFLAAGAAHAVTGVLISASGTWDGGAPSTAISAPGATWSLSFEEPNPLNMDPGTVVGQGWSTAFAQDFTYTLNNVKSTSTLTSITFYDAGQGGGLDLYFNSSADIFTVFSSATTVYADENTGAVVAQPFTDAITIAYNVPSLAGDDAPVHGGGTLSITTQTFTPTNPNNPTPCVNTPCAGPGGGPVPEPAAWALMALGVGLLGFAMRRRSAAGLMAASA